MAGHAGGEKEVIGKSGAGKNGRRVEMRVGLEEGVGRVGREHVEAAVGGCGENDG